MFRGSGHIFLVSQWAEMVLLIARLQTSDLGNKELALLRFKILDQDCLILRNDGIAAAKCNPMQYHISHLKHR